jgi:hypothetical protein
MHGGISQSCVTFHYKPRRLLSYRISYAPVFPKFHMILGTTVVYGVSYLALILAHITGWGENRSWRRPSRSTPRSDGNRWGSYITPLILTQPSGLQRTAAECGQIGLGMEEAEAMDMERD